MRIMIDPHIALALLLIGYTIVIYEEHAVILTLAGLLLATISICKRLHAKILIILPGILIVMIAFIVPTPWLSTLTPLTRLAINMALYTTLIAFIWRAQLHFTQGTDK